MPAALTLKHRLLRKFAHQRWITRGRMRVVRTLCNPDTVADIPFEVDYFGKRYAGSLANFMDWTIYFFGRYESEELALFRDVARALRSQRDQVTFYDVGANAGTHSLFMSGQVSQVHAFEPNPAMVERLTSRIRGNSLQNVTVHPVGLADSAASICLTTAIRASAASSTMRANSVSRSACPCAGATTICASVSCRASTF